MNTTDDDAPVGTVRLPQGTIGYRDIGSGPNASASAESDADPDEVVLFVHGILVSGDLWRDVVNGLGGRIEGSTVRCLVPTLPLGGHRRAMDKGADLTPPGLARLLRDSLDALGVERVTLVGNDTGGAICQVFLARYPERVSRFVLTNCDAFENFLPPLFRPLQYGARVPGVTYLVTQSLRLRPVSWLVFAAVAKTPVSRADRQATFDGVIHDPGVRRDLRAVLRGISSRHTVEAPKSFPAYDEPVLLVWATDNPFFPTAFAERLAAVFPNVQSERVSGSRAFVPVDRPRRLADSIAAFVSETRVDEADRALDRNLRSEI